MAGLAASGVRDAPPQAETIRRNNPRRRMLDRLVWAVVHRPGELAHRLCAARRHASAALVLLAVVAAAFALTAAFQAPAAHAQATPAAPPCSPAKRTGRFYVTLPVNGAQRSALVNVPPTSDGTQRLPLVLVYHGASSTGIATEQHLRISQLGNRYGFIAVYPTSNGDYWNYGTSGAHRTDDIQFSQALLDSLDQQLCVDDQHVYAVGGSSGAAFVYELGCVLSSRLAAVAMVAGVYGVQPPCQPERPISMLEIHGTLDNYRGGGRAHSGSVPAMLNQWAATDGCPQTPFASRRFAPHVLLYEKFGCANGTTVAHIKLIGGIHAWPGAADLSHGPQVDFDVDASLAVWQFFECQAAANPAGPGCPQPQFRLAKARHRHRRR